jgi:hypothetical protein
VGVLITILTSALVSTAVSAILGALLKYNFDRRLLAITHQNQVDLVKLSEDLKVVHNAVLERDRQRREVLPRIAEQVYRIRNRTRSVLAASQDANLHSNENEQLQNEINELEIALYQYRVLLESEGLFLLVHRFKNAAKLLHDLSTDLSLVRSEPNSDIGDLQTQLMSTYEAFDVDHEEIVSKITDIVNLSEGPLPWPRGTQQPT